MPLVNPNAGRKYPTRRNLGLTPGKTTADLNQVKLRQITETERKQWEAETRDKDLLHHSFWNLDELVEYPFKVCCLSAIEPFLSCIILINQISSLSQEGDNVWIRTVEENWLHGKVTGKNIRVGQTRRVSLIICLGSWALT